MVALGSAGVIAVGDGPSHGRGCWFAGLILLVVVQGLGCTSQRVADGGSLDDATVALVSEEDFPPFPATREVVAAVGGSVQGRDAILRSENTRFSSAALHLDSSDSEMAWGVWVLDAEARELQKLHFDFSLAQGQKLYAAVADFSSASWEIHGPFDADAVIRLYSLRHRSTDGLLYCAVIAAVGMSGNCVKIDLEADSGANQAPVAVLQADHPTGPAPLEVQLNAASSHDFDGRVENFEWDLDADDRFNESGPEEAARGLAMPPSLFTCDVEGVYIIQLRVTDNGGLSSTTQITLAAGGTEPPPTAVLTSYYFASGYAPLEAALYAGASTDNSQIEGFEWDLDGDGQFSEPGPEADHKDINTAYYDYLLPGHYNATVMVTDDAGLSSYAWCMMHAVSYTNLPPVAALVLDKTTGRPPLEVEVDGSGSYDPDGEIADYEWNFDEDYFYNEPGAEAAARGVAHPDPLVFTENRTIQLQVTDSEGIRSTAYASVFTSDQPPSVTLAVDKADGPAPLDLVFDLIVYDEWGISDIEWDLDGDTVFNEAGLEAQVRGQQGEVPYTYADAGSVLVAVRVTDTDTPPNVVTRVRLITAGDGGWTIVDFPSTPANAVVDLVSLSDGRPAMLMRSADGSSCLYMVSTTPTGESPRDWLSVELGAFVENNDSTLAVIDGNPAFVYQTNNYDLGSCTLRYVYSTSIDGANLADWHELAVDPYGSTGYHPRLANIDGRPAIAYQNKGHDLVFARSSTPGGQAIQDWASLQVAEDIGYADEMAFAEIQGCPAVLAGGSFGLQYFFSSSANGTNPADWQAITIPTGGAASFSGVALSDSPGGPTIAASPVSYPSGFYFLRSSTPSGSAEDDWSSIVVGDVYGCRPYGICQGSLAMLSGKPAILYEDHAAGLPRLAESATPDGAAVEDWQIPIVASNLGLDYYSKGSLTEIQGRPAVSFRGVFSGNKPHLRYAIRHP